MDRILVFDQRKIIEQGSHQVLLKKKGHYAHMWQMQAGGFLPDYPKMRIMSSYLYRSLLLKDEHDRQHGNFPT
jgi:hypothetical protein